MDTNETIGVARMLPDETIEMFLRAQGAGGLRGDGRFTYAKDSPHYAAVLAHLGGMKPGEEKPVRPWP